MKRQVFFSFHYDRDVWRASQIRNMGKVDNSSTFSDNDWEEVRYKSDAKIKEWIDSQLAMRSCLVVLVGYETSQRKWVKYEIEQAMKLRKGIVGIRINRLKDRKDNQDPMGSNPFYNILTSSGNRLSNYVKLFESGYSTSTYVYDDIKNNIESLIEDAISHKWDY
ncbi:MAG: TIR domain-containing protein [Bacteroidales bacterium]|nr:TIR domain-containing protein [Bacteroidales bacterium]